MAEKYKCFPAEAGAVILNDLPLGEEIVRRLFDGRCTIVDGLAWVKGGKPTTGMYIPQSGMYFITEEEYERLLFLCFLAIPVRTRRLRVGITLRPVLYA